MASERHSPFLNGDELRTRLESGEIFRPGTWSASSLRLAGYDVRIASDVMVVPEQTGRGPSLTYREGEHRTQPIRLGPGDSALVSSAERVAVPLDVAGNLGAKFSLLAEGVLVLTGLLLDPGYGMLLDEEQIVATEDTRLHFLLANIGSDIVELRPGDVVAAAQFFRVYQTSQSDLPRSVGGQSLQSRYFDPHAPARPLVLFSAIDEASRETRETREALTALDTLLTGRIAEFDRRLDIIEGGSKQVTMFGVFLVSVTVLAAALVALVDAVLSIEGDTRRVQYVEIGTMAFACAVVVIFTAWLARQVVSSLGNKR